MNIKVFVIDSVTTTLSCFLVWMFSPYNSSSIATMLHLIRQNLKVFLVYVFIYRSISHHCRAMTIFMISFIVCVYHFDRLVCLFHL